MKVAKMIDRYTVAITLADGPLDGVSEGDILVIGSEELKDPENGEVLGRLPRVRVKVTEVHPRFALAQTYILGPKPPPGGATVVNVGDEVSPL